jgi:hypothetical protein
MEHRSLKDRAMNIARWSMPGGELSDFIEYVREQLYAAVEQEREACAMLHKNVRTHCDHEPPAGAGAMGAVIAYRDAIRARSE